MISERSVQEVRDRANGELVELVGEAVSLKKSGRDWKGKCPFHEDRSPSFYVVPEKGFYKCFGCGETGDAFTWLEKRQGMGFQDAVRYLAGRFGIELQESSGRGEEDPYGRHWEANAFARDWFRRQLLEEEVGAPARSYLEARGIDTATAERFSLGYAPDGWRTFREAAALHGISDDLLLEVGLLTRSERRPEPYDRFRDRIIFPIESVSGRPLAFGGRIFRGESSPGVPKYLNSPESPLYHKGEVLYALGWHRNAIRREGMALLVEGYMDVVSLAAGGVDHAVAALGTALTEEHARLLQRYTGRALLLFDSDEAGLRASFRAADLLLSHGIQPSVVTFPPGEDPDSVMRKEGREGFQRYLDQAIDVLDRKILLLEEKGYFRSIDRVRTAVDKLLPTLRAVRDPALRDIYTHRVAEKTGVRRETLEEELRMGEAAMELRRPNDRGGGGIQPHSGAPGRRMVPEGGPRPGVQGGRGAVVRPRLPGVGGPERQLLLVLLRNREWIDRAAEQVGGGEFLHSGYRAIFEALLRTPGLADAQEGGLEGEEARLLEQLLGDPEDLQHTDQLFRGALAAIRDRSTREREAVLKGELVGAPSSDEARRIGEALAQLRRERGGRWGVVRWNRSAGQDMDDQGTSE